jgi:hypothetical protein
MDDVDRRPRRTTVRKSSGRTTRFALGNIRARSPGQPTRIIAEDSGGGLSRKLGAPLAATSREDGATGASAHPQTETVDLGTPTVVRLEGSLAHGGISKTDVIVGKNGEGPEKGVN